MFNRMRGFPLRLSSCLELVLHWTSLKHQKSKSLRQGKAQLRHQSKIFSSETQNLSFPGASKWLAVPKDTQLLILIVQITTLRIDLKSYPHKLKAVFLAAIAALYVTMSVGLVVGQQWVSKFNVVVTNECNVMNAM